MGSIGRYVYRTVLAESAITRFAATPVRWSAEGTRAPAVITNRAQPVFVLFGVERWLVLPAEGSSNSVSCIGERVANAWPR